MALNDPLANALSAISNAEKAGKKICIVRPASKIIVRVLTLMKTYNYIKDFKVIKDDRGNIVEIELLGTINRCNVIKPRFFVKKNSFEKFEKRYLPAKDFGIILVSTSNGVMTHNEAKEKQVGGSLLAYCY